MTTYEELVDSILKEAPGQKRWRRAVEVWLKLNPKNEYGITARQENAQIIKENKQDTQLNTNKYGTSDDKNSGVRSVLRMPTGAMTFIELSDPQAFKTNDSLGEIFKTFPEYRRAEAF